MAYQETGDSNNLTIVFLHSTTSNITFFKSQLASSLADDYFLIAPNFLGHRVSGFIEGEVYVRPVGLAPSITALAEALGIKGLSCSYMVSHCEPHCHGVYSLLSAQL